MTVVSKSYLNNTIPELRRVLEIDARGCQGCGAGHQSLRVAVTMEMTPRFSVACTTCHGASQWRPCIELAIKAWRSKAWLGNDASWRPHKPISIALY